MRAVLFDLDDTLLDNASAMHKAAEQWGIAEGLAPGCGQKFLALDKELFAAFERGELTYEGQRAEKTRRFLRRPELGDAQALEKFADYLAAYHRNWQAFADAAPALRRALAAGWKVGVLTNGGRQMQAEKLKAGGLNLEGVELIATVDLGTPKPDPRAYAAGCEALGVAPEQTLMVGDSLNNDVIGARQAGLQALWLDRDGAGDIASLDELEFAQSLSNNPIAIAPICLQRQTRRTKSQ